MRTLIALFAIFLAGCAGFGEAVTADGYTIKHDEFRAPAPENDQGVVYFYGNNALAFGTLVFQDGERVSVVQPSSVSYIYAAPGEHEYSAKLNGESVARFTVEAGESYYLRFSNDVGFWGPRPNLERVPEVTGAAAIGALQYITLKDVPIVPNRAPK